MRHLPLPKRPRFIPRIRSDVARRQLARGSRENNLKSYNITTVNPISESRRPITFSLMSLIDWPSEYRIHLNLIEVSQSNRGETKKSNMWGDV